MNTPYFKFAIIILAVIANFAQCFELETTAIIRNKRFKAKEQRVVLGDLTSKTHFTGKYFRIVYGKSGEAIPFKTDDMTKLRASTVYYQLSKARQFFVTNFPDLKLREKLIVVRIDIKNVFNSLAHFANDAKDPQYNNALTVPAGLGLPSRGVAPWNTEIWFRPVKRIKIKEFNNGVPADVKGVFKQFRNQQQLITFQRFLGQTVSIVSAGGHGVEEAIVDSFIRSAGSAIILEAVYQASGPLNWLLSPKKYYLDTAMVPEIIYHEYAHVALSDFLELSHSSPVNEGMADYFAGRISDNPKLAKKIKKFSNFGGKNAKKHKLYNSSYELLANANDDFVFTLFWRIKEEFGEDFADSLIYETRTLLSSSANIHRDLIEALLETCRNKCAQKSVDRLKLYQLFHKLGL